ncbi:MAG: prepilin-type N-terminal cleavage/methylation domain-containing protein [Cyanobium sp. ELA507]
MIKKHLAPRRNQGFSLFEIMIVIAIIGILASQSISVYQSNLRAADAHLLTRELAAWLSEIAMVPEQLNQNCTVTLYPSTSLNPGASMATVTPTSCAAESTLLVPGHQRLLSYQLGATPTSWTYTRRGALSTESTNIMSTNTDLIIRVSVNGESPLRCLKVSGTLGLIRFGRNDSSGDVSNTTSCSNWQRT